jgi:hypothetical protein
MARVSRKLGRDVFCIGSGSRVLNQGRKRKGNGSSGKKEERKWELSIVFSWSTKIVLLFLISNPAQG